MHGNYTRVLMLLGGWGWRGYLVLCQSYLEYRPIRGAWKRSGYWGTSPPIFLSLQLADAAKYKSWPQLKFDLAFHHNYHARVQKQYYCIYFRTSFNNLYAEWCTHFRQRLTRIQLHAGIECAHSGIVNVNWPLKLPFLCQTSWYSQH